MENCSAQRIKTMATYLTRSDREHCISGEMFGREAVEERDHSGETADGTCQDPDAEGRNGE
jgi:hypothetical protein